MNENSKLEFGSVDVFFYEFLKKFWLSRKTFESRFAVSNV